MDFFDNIYILHIISHFIQSTRKNWKKELSSLKYLNIKPVWFHADWRPPLFSCSFLSFQMWRNFPLPCVPRWFSYNLPTINYFSHIKIYRIISLFVCMFRIFHIPLENVSLIWRCHHYWRGATNFDQCSALMIIEQWGFVNASHLLWHGPTLYNGHLWEPVTLTLVAKHLAVDLSLVVLKT